MDHSTLSPDELHLLYILLDSNLPTGGFVSSSGLESYVKHGFLGLPSSSSPYNIDIGGDQQGFTAVKGVKDVIKGVTEFAKAEVGHYGQTTGCFVKDSHIACSHFLNSVVEVDNDDDQELPPSESTHNGKEERTNVNEIDSFEHLMETIINLDTYHESTLLSHVARRASKSQGVAMLTLFTRGLSRPVGYDPDHDDGVREGEAESEVTKREVRSKLQREERSAMIVDTYKRSVRKGVSPGHLAVCWGVITATLGLSVGMTLFALLLGHLESYSSASQLW